MNIVLKHISITVSKKPSNKLLPPFVSVLLDFQHSSWSLWLCSDPSAASSTLCSTRNCGTSSTLSTQSKTQSLCPLENSTLEVSELRAKWLRGFSLLSQVSLSLITELTVAKLTNSTLSSCGEHDPDQHDDGHHQHGLWGHKESDWQIQEQVRDYWIHQKINEGTQRNSVSIDFIKPILIYLFI